MKESPAQANAARMAEAHVGFVKSLAVRIAPFPGCADDIAQEVFVEFISHAERWDYSRDIKPLLAGIARNVARRQWREKTRCMTAEMRDLAEYVAEVAEDKEVEWYGEEEKIALKRCLAALADKSRKLVELRFWLSLNSTEIARKIGAKATAIRQALSRTRAELLRCMAKQLKTERSHV